MPVFTPDSSWFPKRTLEETSPFAGVLSNAIDKRLKMAQAQKAETEAKYSERKTLADILNQELVNKYYAPNIESEIAQRKATTDKIMKEIPWIDREKASEIAGRWAQTNRSTKLLPFDIQKAQDEINESKMNRALQQQIQDAITSGNVPTSSGNASYNPQIPMNPSYRQNNASNQVQAPLPVQNVGQAPMPASAKPSAMEQASAKSPMQPFAQNIGEGIQEKIVSQGSPNLEKIDHLYESNPLARSQLEKMGFKKTQQIKVDKSGNPTIITKYPSGKVTVQSQSGIGDEGIPLTTKMISQHQNVVSSVDVALPVLDKIIKMKDDEYSRFGGYTSKGANYSATVNQGLDSLLGAFGLPQTNEGIKSMMHQLEIGHGESPKAYRKRMEELKKDIIKRQQYSANLVKKAVKIQEDNEATDPYSLNQYMNVSGE